MRCVVCEKHLAGNFSLCRKCEDVYGRTEAERPAWLNYLISQNVREEQERINDEKDLESIEFVEEVMSQRPDRRLTGYFRDLYASQRRPCEEEALNNVEDKKVINKLIKFFGGIVKE